MDEMYVERRFGPRSPDQTPHNSLAVQDVLVENYFAPERELSPFIADFIERAQDEVLVMAFSFTNEEIGEAMLARARAGVELRAVFETVGSDTEYSYYPRFAAANLPQVQVRQDGNPRIMHHKVIIIDRRSVLFGSFNFTNSANDQNDENIVIMHDPAFAQAFIAEFERVWDSAKAP
jgi:phosphatidylserine/phosphatidylglycerophosphate/cardiolipin synthase-like enzyme